MPSEGCENVADRGHDWRGGSVRFSYWSWFWKTDLTTGCDRTSRYGGYIHIAGLLRLAGLMRDEENDRC